MKSVILAGGRGTRLDELSAVKNKCMTRVNGKPVIEYSLDCAVAADVEEIIIVVGHRAEEIINSYGNRYKDKQLKYVVQWEQHGLVHAISCARESIGGDNFMLLLGDEIYINARHRDMLKRFREGDVFALCGVLWVEDKEFISRTYTLFQSDNNRIHRLIEKPRNPLNNFMGTGSCIFKNEILDYIETTPVHYIRKEKELPDLIQCAIDDGKLVESFNISSRYVNINTKDDIKIAEMWLESEQVGCGKE